MTDPSLFPDLVPVDPMPPAVVEKLSDGRRLTLRQKENIVRGRHPLAPDMWLLADNGETCGTCVHRIRVDGGNREYPKCDLTTMSASASSDCRAWWPACTRWAAKS
jgi:hypothetical protein